MVAATASRFACEPEPTSSACERRRPSAKRAENSRAKRPSVSQPSSDASVERLELRRADDPAGRPDVRSRRARTRVPEGLLGVAADGGERVRAQGVEVGRGRHLRLPARGSVREGSFRLLERRAP